MTQIMERVVLAIAEMVRHDWSPWVEQEPVEVRYSEGGVITAVAKHAEARVCTRCHKMQIRTRQTSLMESRELFRASIAETARGITDSRSCR